MIIHFLSLFPEMFTGPLSESIMKRAQEQGNVKFQCTNIRDFTQDKHHTTDQPPYGGGAGMVMMVEPIHKALQSLRVTPKSEGVKIVLLSAKGSPYSQKKAVEYSKLDILVLICGHYEGVDERVKENLIDEEVRIGNFVVTGGELPAMMIADSVVRLLPGVLGDDESIQDESHKQPGYFEYPQYTRPATYNGWKVPEALLHGDHKQIGAWRILNATYPKTRK